MPGRQKALQHIATALVGLSGAAYGWMKYMLPEPEDPFSLVRHPLQPWALDLHVLSAPLFLVAVGVILKDHILARLADPRRRRGRRSGALAALLLVPMAASGYLLQTSTSETWRSALLWVHLGSGTLFLCTYLVHLAAGILAVRRRRAMAAGRAEGPQALAPGSLRLRQAEGARPSRRGAETAG
jgi:hypothetical protein